MILIFAEKITNRIRYTFNLMLSELLGVNIDFTDDVEYFKNFNGAKISYHSHQISDELFFVSKPILFERNINEIAINTFDYEGNKVFFPTNKNSALPFDPFAASFYLVSRYEEYLPHINDLHGRFDGKESLAYKSQPLGLTRPLVNIWANKIKQIIQQKYPEIIFPKKKFEFISTIDIDNVYAYKEKGVMRTLGAYYKSFSKNNMEEVVERTRVLTGKEADPYDTYDYQLELQKKYNFKSIYFFLLANYGLNDKNVSSKNIKFQSLIKNISDYADVGIHPGYGSNSDKSKLQKEIKRLENILHRPVTKSRQHFLILNFPDTYRNLIEMDIMDDYTMGYATMAGFRASICTPFYFYDLDLDVPTKLKIHPFVVMDATLKHYMKLNPDEAIQHIYNLIGEVKKVDGTFISLWHNETMSENKMWKGWRKVYENMVEYVIK